MYHLGLKSGYGKIDGHDVVVVHEFRKKGWCIAKSITSLERYGEGKHRWAKSGLKWAREGKITPVPLNEREADHWSRIDSRTKFVRSRDLKKACFVKKGCVKKKFRK